MSVADIIVTNELIDDFAEHLRDSERFHRRTVDAYVADAALYDRWLHRLEFTPRTSKAALIRMWLHPMPQATRNRKLSSIRRLHAWLCETGRRHDNPTAEIQAFRPHHEVVVPDDNDLDALIAAVREADGDARRDRAVVALLLDVALTVGELAALQVHDITLSDLSLRVGSPAARRTVYYSHETSEVLAVALDERNERVDRFARTHKQRTTGHLFLTNRGAGFTRQGMWKIVHRHAVKAGVSLSPRTLRIVGIRSRLQRGVSSAELGLSADACVPYLRSL